MAKMERFLSDQDEFQASVRRLPSRWGDVIGVKVPRRIAGQRESDVHLRAEFYNGNNTGEADRRQFAVVYRAIRRYLTRRLYKRHQACIDGMGRSIWFSINGRAFIIKPFCPEAYALLLWRMYWKKIDVPQKLVARQLTLVKVDLEVDINWIPVTLPNKARVRVLSLECWRTYRRCCDLAGQMQNKDEVTFPLWRVNSASPGEWIGRGLKASNRYELHWWWPKRWVERATFPSHNRGRKCDKALLPIAC
jgi:hypothetical protein